MNSFEDDLHSAFKQLEDDILDAIPGDELYTRSFVERLSHLHRITTSAISTQALSTNILGFIKSVSSTGALVSNNLLRLHNDTCKVEEERQADIADVLNRLSLGESGSDLEPGLSKERRKTSPRAPSRQPPHRFASKIGRAHV